MPRSRASNTSSPMYLSRGALTIVHNSAEQSFGRAKIGTFCLRLTARTKGIASGRGFLRGGRILRSN